jgi:hypothetical protein
MCQLAFANQSRSGPVLDYNVLALDITGFTEALSKCGQIWLCASGSDAKKTNHGRRRLLRPRRERPSGG